MRPHPRRARGPERSRGSGTSAVGDDRVDDEDGERASMKTALSCQHRIDSARRRGARGPSQDLDEADRSFGSRTVSGSPAGRWHRRIERGGVSDGPVPSADRSARCMSMRSGGRRHRRFVRIARARRLHSSRRSTDSPVIGATMCGHGCRARSRSLPRMMASSADATSSRSPACRCPPRAGRRDDDERGQHDLDA